MDMSMPGMSMPGMVASATSATYRTTTETLSTAAASASAIGGMEDMNGGHMECKISMLWNWSSVGACFISPNWQITSRGAMAASCIGVVFLVVGLEFLRRTSKEFDRWIVQQHRRAGNKQRSEYTRCQGLPAGEHAGKGSMDSGRSPAGAGCGAVAAPPRASPCRPNVWQQAVRAGLHTLQFALAYFIMLLAMYYNGYIIISIIIGAYIGSFVFQWETLAGGSTSSTSGASEPTVCCG